MSVELFIWILTDFGVDRYFLSLFLLSGLFPRDLFEVFDPVSLGGYEINVYLNGD